MQLYCSFQEMFCGFLLVVVKIHLRGSKPLNLTQLLLFTRLTNQSFHFETFTPLIGLYKLIIIDKRIYLLDSIIFYTKSLLLWCNNYDERHNKCNFIQSRLRCWHSTWLHITLWHHLDIFDRCFHLKTIIYQSELWWTLITLYIT